MIDLENYKRTLSFPFSRPPFFISITAFRHQLAMSPTERLLVNPIFGLSIRGTQWLFAILTFALNAYAVDKFARAGGFIWTIVVGIITVVYIPTLLALRVYSPGGLNPGAIVTVDSLLALFYFTAFIASAAQIGNTSCDFSFAGYYYVYAVNKNACQSSKAAVAFAAFNFALFTFTAAILGLYVVKASGDNLFKYNSETGAYFDPAVLALTASSQVNDPAPVNYDEEAQVDHEDGATVTKEEAQDAVDDEITNPAAALSTKEETKPTSVNV